MVVEPAELSTEKLEIPEGVRELNRIVRELAQEGKRMMFPYGDASARSADNYLKAVGDGVLMSATSGWRMLRKGSIVGNSTLVEITTATSGDVTFEVRINDTNQSVFENEFTSVGGAGVKSKSVTKERFAVAFNVGDIIQIFANETGVMAWDNVIGYVEVEFDD